MRFYQHFTTKGPLDVIRGAQMLYHDVCDTVWSDSATHARACAAVRMHEFAQAQPIIAFVKSRALEVAYVCALLFVRCTAVHKSA